MLSNCSKGYLSCYDCYKKGDSIRLERTQELLDALALAMIDYDAGSAERIQHFLKVHSFSQLIGIREGMDAHSLFILETAAYVHDIGIKAAEEKYGRQNGRLQEQEGPALAEAMLEKLGFDMDVIQRVSFLVGHHHTYENVDGMDWQILLEADYLVNAYECQIAGKGIYAARERIFRTETGKELCVKLYGDV